MQKPSENEQKYFHEENQRIVSDIKEEIDVESSSYQNWQALAKSVGSDDASIGEKLESLGFSTDTSSVLIFVPLIEVAWSDGKIGYEESYKIVDNARKRGVRATSKAYDLLSELTLKRPSKAFFDGCNAVIRSLLDAMTAEDRLESVNDLASLCVQVAKASRGFFGFGADVSPEEIQAIKEIVSELNIEDASSTASLLAQYQRLQK